VREGFSVLSQRRPSHRFFFRYSGQLLSIVSIDPELHMCFYENVVLNFFFVGQIFCQRDRLRRSFPHPSGLWTGVLFSGWSLPLLCLQHPFHLP
jgi:hypothetical protein